MKEFGFCGGLEEFVGSYFGVVLSCFFSRNLIMFEGLFEFCFDYVFFELVMLF